MLRYCINVIKCHKISLDRDGSYADSPDWMKNKKETTNSINKKGSKCCQYAVTVTLNNEDSLFLMLRMLKNKKHI